MQLGCLAQDSQQRFEHADESGDGILDMEDCSSVAVVVSAKEMAISMKGRPEKHSKNLFYNIVTVCYSTYMYLSKQGKVLT